MDKPPTLQMAPLNPSPRGLGPQSSMNGLPHPGTNGASKPSHLPSSHTSHSPTQHSPSYAHSGQGNHYSYGHDPNPGYHNLQSQPYMDQYGTHQSPAPTSAPGYSSHLQSSYTQAPSSYGSVISSYPYSGSNGVLPSGQPPSSAPGGASVGSGIALPYPSAAMNPAPPMGSLSSTSPSTVSNTGSQYGHAQMDTTGQVAPHGMKPRVTATLWEDEGSLCFQVEAKGVCVARREDNHFINGTKLLNVAGMTRGRRDGILKSEKVRHVVKIGPMHLKGVWIPFERALDFANKEKITELLYPLFVHNIGALLYHPTNSQRTSAVMKAAQDNRANQAIGGQRSTPTSQAPPPMHHHHGLHPVQPLPSSHSGMTHHHQMGRPGLGERSLSVPNPPSNGPGIMNVNSNPDSSYNYPPQGGMVPSSASQPLPLGSDSSRSMPATPTSNTPPAGMLQQSMPYPPYSDSRSSSYAATQQNIARFGQPNMGANSGQYRPESQMGPPQMRGIDRPSSRPGDEKPDNLDNHSSIHDGAPHEEEHVEEEGEHDDAPGHPEDYSHGASSVQGSYNNNHRSSYYPSVSDHGSAHLSPEMTHSPGGGPHGQIRQPYTQQGIIPRSVESKPHWNNQDYVAPSSSHTGMSSQMTSKMYGDSTPPRNMASSYTLVSADDRRPIDDVRGQESPYYPQVNGSAPGSNKRMREMDDDDSHGSRPSSRGDDAGLKRRKTFKEGSAGSFESREIKPLKRANTVHQQGRGGR